MYATLIYQSLGWNSGSQALAINGIQSVLQLFIVLVNTFTVDRFGRRGLLLAGFAIQSLALLIMSCLTTAYPSNGNKAAAVVEVAMLFIVGMTYCWSNGPIAAAVVAEIFPQHVRDKVCCRRNHVPSARQTADDIRSRASGFPCLVRPAGSFC